MICDNSKKFRYFAAASETYCCEVDYEDFGGMRCSVSAGRLDAYVHVRGRSVAHHTVLAIALVS